MGRYIVGVKLDLPILEDESGAGGAARFACPSAAIQDNVLEENK